MKVGQALAVYESMMPAELAEPYRRALNGMIDRLAATRDRVLRSIEELCVISNGSGRCLRAGTISNVGAVLLDIALTKAANRVKKG